MSASTAGSPSNAAKLLNQVTRIGHSLMQKRLGQFVRPKVNDTPNARLVAEAYRPCGAMSHERSAERVDANGVKHERQFTTRLPR